MPWRTAAASSGRKPPGTRRPAATNQLRLRQHPQEAGAPPPSRSPAPPRSWFSACGGAHCAPWASTSSAAWPPSPYPAHSRGCAAGQRPGGRKGGNLQPPTTGSVRHHGAPRSLAQDPLNGLLSAEVGGVKPPAQVSEAISHRGPQLFVALEEELLLGRTDLVAVPARVATRIEDDEQ